MKFESRWRNRTRFFCFIALNLGNNQMVDELIGLSTHHSFGLVPSLRWQGFVGVAMTADQDLWRSKWVNYFGIDHSTNCIWWSNHSFGLIFCSWSLERIQFCHCGSRKSQFENCFYNFGTENSFLISKAILTNFELKTLFLVFVLEGYF